MDTPSPVPPLARVREVVGTLAEQVVLEVADDGPGLSGEDLEEDEAVHGGAGVGQARGHGDHAGASSRRTNEPASCVSCTSVRWTR